MRPRATETDLRLLRYFVTAADELHFARAAERLGVTPPTLSHQIRKLEDEVGVPLFTRAHRRVELSAAGRALLPSARGVLQAAGEWAATAERVAGGRSGVVRVVHTGTTRETLVPRLARRLAREHPEITLELREAPNGTIPALVLDEAADLGLARTPDVPNGLAHAVVERQRLVVLTAEDDPRARAENVALEELRGATVALWPRARSPELHDLLVAHLDAAGLHVDRRWELHQDLVSVVDGEAVVVGPPALGAYRAGLAATPVVPPIETTMHLLWRAHDTDPVVATVRHVALALPA
jgi:DNA-binding transcriptional LysR family regulator